MNKQDLRKQYLAKRLALSADEYALLNQQFLSRFKGLDLSGTHCIHIYLPMLPRKEPDTLLIIEWLKINHPHIERVFPKTNFADLSITNYLDDAQLRSAENPWGITEPVIGTEIETDRIDMVIVPLLIFDERGYRVGYGKGFYDRFMTSCKPGTQFVGLSLFDPVDRIDDVDQYDMALHQCLTPSKTWVF